MINKIARPALGGVRYVVMGNSMRRKQRALHAGEGLSLTNGGPRGNATMAIDYASDLIFVNGGGLVYGGVMVDGVALRDNGEAHRDIANNNDTGNMGSVCIVDCPNGDEEISLWVINDLSNDLHIVHSTVSVKRIGET